MYTNGEALFDVSGASPYALVCRSACVLQAGSNAGDGAEDQIDESCLLALRVLLQFFLSRVRPIVSFDSTTNVLHQAQIMW